MNQLREVFLPLAAHLCMLCALGHVCSPLFRHQHVMSVILSQVHLFQGVRFDPDISTTLRLEFAKSNTKVTKPSQRPPMLTPPAPFPLRDNPCKYHWQ